MVTINGYKKESAAPMSRAKDGYKFCENGLWGLKSKDGEMLIAAKYDQLGICRDYVYARYDRRHTYFYYNGATSDSPIWDDDYRFYKDGKIGLHDEDGNIFLPAVYDEIYDWGEDCDVIYTRMGNEFHYYNHNKEEILLKVDPIPEDAYPERPYCLGEDQNREVLLCVEPADAKVGGDICFAYKQWVKLSRIPRKDIRAIFSSCEIVPMPDHALHKFYDKDTYIYSARYCKASGEHAIMDCINVFKSLDAYESSWSYLVKISVNRNTAVNIRDLYGAIKHFEDYEEWCHYNISIGYDDTLSDGELSVFQVHYFWDDGGAFLYNDVYRDVLPEGSFDDIVDAIRDSENREDLLDEAYWWIRYSENRGWNETKKILDWLHSQGASNIRTLIDNAIETDIWESNKDVWAFKCKIVHWAVVRGANVNYIKNGKTVLDKIQREIEEKEKYRNKYTEDIENIKCLKEFHEFLIEIGGVTAEEERQRMETLVDRLTPEELVKVSGL